MSAVPHRLQCDALTTPLGVELNKPRLRWMLSAPRMQQAWQIHVASHPRWLEANQPDLWDSGRVTSSQSVDVAYEGVPLISRQRAWWRVRVWTEDAADPGPWSEPSWWEAGLLNPADWSALWIAAPGGVHVNWECKPQPAPLFRRGFELPGHVTRARLYASGLGYSEFFVNAQRVGDAVLDPCVSQYDKHVPYVTHDVTDLLTSGHNVVTGVLGNGWYNTHTAEVWHFDKVSWRDYPKLLLQLEVTLHDGRTFVITSDEQWRVGQGGTRFDGLRNGETFDARLEPTGWMTRDFDDRDWKPAAIVHGPGGLLRAQAMHPCRVVQTIEPVSVRSLDENTHVFDLGQNIAGRCRLSVRGTAGTQVTLQHADKLTDRGDLETTNESQFIKSGDFQTDRFTLAGTVNPETFAPRFTYHGFQYVKLTGLPSPASKDWIQGQVIQTDFPRVGSFSCADDLLNRIHSATLWSYRGNFVGIPTDCPHREKNGWTGDAQLACETGLMNFDATAAYRNWVRMIADAQRPDGQLPGIVPTGGWGFNWGNGPAWDGALILIPYYGWLYRGDSTLLRDVYEPCKRYVDYVAARSPEGIVTFGLGDWCHVDSKRMAPAALTSTGYFREHCAVLARFATLLGHDADAVHYAALGERVAAAAAARFHRGDGLWAWGEQTALACALHQDLAPPDVRASTLDRLVQAIHANAGRLDAGILGAKWILRVLADGGHTDLAYQLLTRTDYPSWGHWITQGATTLWEDWNGQSSRNHIMFGDVSAWMYRVLAGIRPDETGPGFSRFILAPQLPRELSWVKAEYDSPHGLIRSHWRREGSRWCWEYEIPPNSVATVVLPSRDPACILEAEQEFTAQSQSLIACGKPGRHRVILHLPTAR